jgi:hypothetical protein
MGLHRAIPTDLADMTLDRASASYRQAMTEIESYLKEMEVPSRFFQIMESTASSDVRWLSSEEIESLRKVPSITEWLVAGCGESFDPDAYLAGRPQRQDAVECRISKITRTRDAIR